MKNTKTLLAVIALLAVMASCSNDSSSTDSSMKILARGVYNPAAANRNANGVTLNSDVVLSSFKINLKEI